MAFNVCDSYRVGPVEEINRVKNVRRDNYSNSIDSDKLKNNVDNHKPFSEYLREKKLVKKK